MNQLTRNALARATLSQTDIQGVYDTFRVGAYSNVVGNLCESHERLRYELQGAENLLAELGQNPDWKQSLRYFAEDSKLHQFCRDDWRQDMWRGVTLYSHEDFFVAYFDEANIFWDRSNAQRPMHHVMVRSDPPHRTAIHKIHLGAWIAHLSETRIPVQILALASLTEIGPRPAALLLATTPHKRSDQC